MKWHYKKPVNVKRVNGVKIFKVAGNFNLTTTPHICRLCDDLVKGKEEVKGILLDFENVGEVDTTAFACMINFIRHHMNEGVKVGIIHYNKKVKDLMVILKIDKLIPTFVDEKEAIDRLSHD